MSPRHRVTLSPRHPLPGLLLAGLVAFAILAPLALNWLRHPDQLLLRSGQIAVGGGAADVSSPWQNLLAALGMFSFRGDADPRNNVPGLPVLDALMSIPFYLEIGWALWTVTRRGSEAPRGSEGASSRLRAAAPLLSVLLAGLLMLIPTMLSEYAPHFRRALGAAPIVALFCGLGLAVILGRRDAESPTQPAAVPWRLRKAGVPPEELAAGMDRLRWWGRVAVVGTILAASGVFSANAYFVRWGQSPALYYAYDQGLWEIGGYVLGLPVDEPVYVTPRPAGDMTLAFAWREGRPVRHFDGRHAFGAPEAGAATYVVIEHEDFRGGRLLRELYPAASEAKVFLDRDGNVYARAFHVADAAALARGPRYAASSHWPGIALVGYDLNQAAYRPGEIVYLQLWWRAAAVIETDWTVFTHLLGPARADGSAVWAGQDARPGQGSVPTTTWTPGDLILDEYQLQLPPDAAPGEYAIEVGLYDPAAGAARAVTSEPPGQDHVILGAAKVD